jgi:hypothetical protein
MGLFAVRREEERGKRMSGNKGVSLHARKGEGERSECIVHMGTE